MSENSRLLWYAFDDDNQVEYLTENRQYLYVYKFEFSKYRDTTYCFNEKTILNKNRILILCIHKCLDKRNKPVNIFFVS